MPSEWGNVDLVFRYVLSFTHSNQKPKACFTSPPRSETFFHIPGPGVVQLPIRLGTIWFRMQEQHGTTLSYIFVVLLPGKYVFIIYQTTQTTILSCNDDVKQSILSGNLASKVLCPISTSLIAPKVEILEVWSKLSWSVGTVRLAWFVRFGRVWCLHPHIWS